MDIPPEVKEGIAAAMTPQERANKRKRDKRAALKLQQAQPVPPVAPTPTAAVEEAPNYSTDTGGLIPKGVANKMANDAIKTPAPAKGHSSKEVAEAAAGVTQVVPAAVAPKSTVLDRAGLVGFNQLDICLMVTLNLSDSRFINGQSKALAKVVGADGKPVNLYSPFRKAKEEKGIAAGIFRPLFNKIFAIIDTVKSSPLLVVADKKHVADTFAKAINTIEADIKGLFPAVEDSAIVEAGVEGISVSDVFRTTSWVNSEGFNTEGISFNQAVINFMVNSGSLYDSEDRAKVVRDLNAILRLYTDKYPSASVLFGVTIAMEDMEDTDIRELSAILLDEDGFSLFTKGKMIRSLSNPEDAQDWIPHNKEGIEANLMPESADALFVKVVTAVKDEDEDGDE